MSLEEEFARRCGQESDISLHMPLLFAETCARKNPVVIELGVCRGNSTIAFLAAGADLWSVDASEPQVPGEWLKLPNWHFLQADDLDEETLEWMPARADILFIDTHHTYEHATAELEAYAPRVKPGGVILMHDTQFADMLDQRDLGVPEGPVAQAIGDFCEASGLTWRNQDGSYGMGIIGIPGENGSCEQ